LDKVDIVIDGREIEAEEGEKVLHVALRNEIFIPNLCDLSQMDDTFAGCRLCFVEVEGEPKPVTSCTQSVQAGMVVRTDTEIVRRLQRSALRLLLSAHHIDCKNCYANRRCKLQEMAKKLGVKLKIEGLRDLSKRDPLDFTLGSVVNDQNKCVLCGACVRLCRSDGEGVFHFSQRGIRTRISTFAQNENPGLLKKCLDVCPVGALIPPDATRHIESME
jgi:NADH dehydrogenase/NADH:ubiquinone oxidoreductase subunit G